jgi:plasmid stabilization system protein ParE
VIVFSTEALGDLERIFSFYDKLDRAFALQQLALIRSAILILNEHPRFGRPLSADLRELIISVGKRGFVALFHYDEVAQNVLILGIRHQREAGYR